MCFSTTASFASGALLTAIGVVSIKKVKHKKQLLFASVPFIFAIQQFAEGFVWLSLLNSTNYFWQQLATYSFLLFAFVIWPALVPLSLFLIERKHKRKRILRFFCFIGLLFSILSSMYLILYNSEASITSYHIHYELNIPFNAKIIIGMLYLIPTIISNFVSSTKGVALMGILIFLSYLVSKLFFGDFVISVWCFFSALISMNIYFIIAREKTFKRIRLV
jgi:hypothetical protein